MSQSLANIALRSVVAGVSLSSTISRSNELGSIFQRTLPAGITGTLSTRTDANTGILTVGSGHGITDADTVAVFFAGGRQVAVDVTATTATTISIDLGVGDDLPVVTTPIVVSVIEIHALAIVGNDLTVLHIDSSTRAYAEFFNGATSHASYNLVAKEGYVWYDGSLHTNPIAGDVITTVRLANGEATAVNFKIGLLTNTAS